MPKLKVLGSLFLFSVFDQFDSVSQNTLFVKEPGLVLFKWKPLTLTNRKTWRRFSTILTNDVSLEAGLC